MDVSPAVRIGCQANAWQREFPIKQDLDKTLAQMAAAGYEGTELPVWSIADLHDPSAVRDLLARHSLDFASIHVGGNFHDPAVFREQTLPFARDGAFCAAAAGAYGVVVSAAPKLAANASPGEYKRKKSDELRHQTAHLAGLAEMHRDLGLITYYHNHVVEFSHDHEEVRSILEVDSALLNLCFDIGNAATVVPGSALLETMTHYWDCIGYLHYKDIKGDTLAEALGEGEIEFDAVGVLARTRKIRGWAVAEIEPAEGMVATRSVLEDARLSCALIRRTHSAEG